MHSAARIKTFTVSRLLPDGANGLSAIHYACTYALKVTSLPRGLLGLWARSYNAFTKNRRAVVQIPE